MLHTYASTNYCTYVSVESLSNTCVDQYATYCVHLHEWQYKKFLSL